MYIYSNANKLELSTEHETVHDNPLNNSAKLTSRINYLGLSFNVSGKMVAYWLACLVDNMVILACVYIVQQHPFIFHVVQHSPLHVNQVRSPVNAS